MQDAPVEQVGDRGEADVRVRPDVEALPGDELDGAEMVEEDERADHLRLPCGRARRTAKPSPRSRVLGTMTRSSASQDFLSPRTGSFVGSQLMGHSSQPRPLARRGPSYRLGITLERRCLADREKSNAAIREPFEEGLPEPPGG